MTLSIFPGLLTYALLAPFIIRVVLGIVFIHFGRNKIKYPTTSVSKGLGIFEILIGLLLIIGLFTQIAALISAIIMIVQLVDKIRSRQFLTDGVNYFLILFAMAVSLLFSGAGFLAFDFSII